MPRLPVPVRVRALLAVAVAVSLAVAACAGPTNPGAGASPTPGGPTGSGATDSCRTAPVPSAEPEGWGPPTTPPSVIPVIIANPGEITCGPNRVLFSFFDAANNPIARPDRTASIAIYDLARDPNTPVDQSDGTFVWAVDNVRGLYVAHLDVPEAGRYGAEFTTAVGSGTPEKIRLTFDIQPASPVVQVGDKAPASKTPTLADVGGDVAKVSTDPQPLKALYETSVDKALAAKQPFVLAFATPKFCTSAQCGPTLDRLKPFVTRYPDVAFINVEPYKLKFENGSLQADLDAGGNLQPTDVTNAWGLLTEPWIFVVDRDGIVRASFELIFTDEELTAALDALE